MVTGAPIRMQLRRLRGFDLQRTSRRCNGRSAAVVARPTPWGNPYRFVSVPAQGVWIVVCNGVNHGRHPDSLAARKASVELYRRYLQMRPSVVSAAAVELRDKNLACWCPLPKPGEPDHCHAAVLLEQIAQLKASA